MTTPEVDEDKASSDEGAVVDMAFIGSFAGSGMGGIAHAVVGGLLGAMGARFTNNQFEIAALGGIAGIAISCAVLIWGLTERNTFRGAVIGLLVGGISAAALDGWIGSQLESRVFRWVFAASIPGAFLGALYGPICAMRDDSTYDNPFTRSKVAVVMAIMYAIANMIKSIHCGAFGIAVAGMLGGAVGSLLLSVLVSEVGGEDLEMLVGNSWLLPVCWGAIGAVGGGIGGLRLRALLTTAAEGREPMPDTPPFAGDAM